MNNIDSCCVEFWQATFIYIIGSTIHRMCNAMVLRILGQKVCESNWQRSSIWVQSKDKALLKSNCDYSKPFDIVRKCVVIVEKLPNEIDECLVVKSSWKCSSHVGSGSEWISYRNRKVLKEMDKRGVQGKRW